MPPADLLDRLGVRPLLEQHQPIQSLSLGQRRRACLAAALVGDPGLLLLDEPTNGLDPGGIAMLAELLRERRDQNRIALVTTHDLALTEMATPADGRMANVHFEDRIEEGRMVFDYRMRTGIVERSNALALMRAVGLKV